MVGIMDREELFGKSLSEAQKWGNIIKALRKHMGWNQLDLAVKTIKNPETDERFSQRSVIEWEKSDGLNKTGTIKAIITAFKDGGLEEKYLKILDDTSWKIHDIGAQEEYDSPSSFGNYLTSILKLKRLDRKDLQSLIKEKTGRDIYYSSIVKWTTDNQTPWDKDINIVSDCLNLTPEEKTTLFDLAEKQRLINKEKRLSGTIPKSAKRSMQKSDIAEEKIPPR